MNILTGDHFLMVSCRKVAPVLHTFFWQQYSQLLLNVSLVILPICLTSGAWSWICGSPRHDEFLHTKITMIHLWENGLKLKYRLAKPECREKLQYCKKHTLWLYKKRKLDYLKKVVFDRWNWLSSVNWPWQLQSAQTLLPVFLTNSKTRLPLMSAISPNTRTKQIRWNLWLRKSTAAAGGLFQGKKLFGNHRKQPNRVPVWCVVITVVRTTIAASSTTTEISIFGGSGGGLWFFSLLPIVAVIILYIFVWPFV